MGLGCPDVATGNTMTRKYIIQERLDTYLSSVCTESMTPITKQRAMGNTEQPRAPEGKKPAQLQGWPEGSAACGGEQTHDIRRQAADNEYASKEPRRDGKTSLYARNPRNARRSGSALKSGANIGAPQLQRQSLNGSHQNASRRSNYSCCPLHIFC